MRILYVPEVIDDLLDVRNWYESRLDGLGEEFLRVAYVAFEELLIFPEKNEIVYGIFRRVLMRRFPYSIYYRYSDDTITVFGVFHSSRDPRKTVDMLGTR